MSEDVYPVPMPEEAVEAEAEEVAQTGPAPAGPKDLREGASVVADLDSGASQKDVEALKPKDE